MAASDLNWELCRSFLAVLDEGNLSRAARFLRLTQPTLGRHVDEMERILGVALFTRSPQGLSPTDAAVDLRPHAEAMAAAADALIRAASGSAGEARGTVRITAPEILGVEVLPPVLTTLRRRYPGIVIELALTNRTLDLLRREADIAVRLVRPDQAALVTRQVGEMRFVLHAHRTYVERHGVPKDLKSLGDHTLIGFDKGMVAIRALRERATSLGREAFSFRSDSAIAQVAMLRAGYGIGAILEGIAGREPDLVPVLAEDFAVKVGVWIAMHEDARATRRMRLVFDHLASALEAFAASNGGPGRKSRLETHRKVPR